MTNAEVSNPNDFKVVSFHNAETFDFTPEMGCMFDGRPINGPSGAPGIQAGETMTLPYHIGNRLAINLAKRVFNTSKSATVDQAGVPTGVPIWNETLLTEKSKTYLKELYTEAKPVAQSETDKLMAKVEEYKKMVETLISQGQPKPEPKPEEPKPDVQPNPQPEKKVYLDKQDVIAELEKRGVKHDKRSNKDTLEKLLV